MLLAQPIGHVRGALAARFPARDPVHVAQLPVLVGTADYEDVGAPLPVRMQMNAPRPRIKILVNALVLLAHTHVGIGGKFAALPSVGGSGSALNGFPRPRHVMCSAGVDLAFAIASCRAPRASGVHVRAPVLIRQRGVLVTALTVSSNRNAARCAGLTCGDLTAETVPAFQRRRIGSNRLPGMGFAVPGISDDNCCGTRAAGAVRFHPLAGGCVRGAPEHAFGFLPTHRTRTVDRLIALVSTAFVAAFTHTRAVV
jgi:hypothetical protein